MEEGDQVKEKGTRCFATRNQELELEKEQNALTIESSYLRLNHLKKQLDRLDEKEEEAEEQIGGVQVVQSIEGERNHEMNDAWPTLS